MIILIRIPDSSTLQSFDNQNFNIQFESPKNTRIRIDQLITGLIFIDFISNLLL